MSKTSEIRLETMSSAAKLKDIKKGMLITFGLILMASVWFCGVIDDATSGWTVVFFLAPVVLFCLLIWCVSLYLLIECLLYPEVNLVLNKQPVIGSEILLSWSFQKTFLDLSYLRVNLRCVEKANCTAGTTRCREENVLLDLFAVMTSEVLSNSNGEARIIIPNGAMHSFQSENNEIAWFFQVTMKIKRLPCMHNHYGVRVRLKQDGEQNEDPPSMS